MTNWKTKQGKLYSRCERCKGTGKYKEWGRYNPCPMYCKDGLIEVSPEKPDWNGTDIKMHVEIAKKHGKQNIFEQNEVYEEQISLKAELIKALKCLESGKFHDQATKVISSYTFKQDKYTPITKIK